MSGIIDKAKDKIQQVTHSGPYSEGHNASGTAAGSTTTGHHTTGTHTTGTHTTGTHTTGTHHTTGGGLGSGTSTNAGPHSSNIANKLDPRVDSDRDGSNTLGSNTTAGTHSNLGTTTGGGLGYQSGLGAAGAGYGTTGAATHTAGPHSSNLANKADPRVDSDLDGSNRLGAGGFGSTGTTGLNQPGAVHSGTGSTGTGLHGTNPGLHSGPGPAPNTAGPHNSDLLNKADPRVDSDLDGSRTVGGNATYQ